MPRKYNRKTKYYCADVVNVLSKKLYNGGWVDGFTVASLYDILNRICDQATMNGENKEYLRFSYPSVHNAVKKLLAHGKLLEVPPGSKFYVPNNRVYKRKFNAQPIIDQVDVKDYKIFMITQNTLAITLRNTVTQNDVKLFEDYLGKDAYCVTYAGNVLILMLDCKKQYLSKLIDDLKKLVIDAHDATSKRFNEKGRQVVFLNERQTNLRKLSKELKIPNNIGSVSLYKKDIM